MLVIQSTAKLTFVLLMANMTGCCCAGFGPTPIVDPVAAAAAATIAAWPCIEAAAADATVPAGLIIRIDVVGVVAFGNGAQLVLLWPLLVWLVVLVLLLR